jgi:ParB family chromosome partitioning protein
MELKHSIRENGLLQPILVRTDGARHVLIAGHRRLEAVRELAVESPHDPRWRKILAIERDTDERTAEALSLIENLQRQDLDPLEEAGAYVRLRDAYGLSLGAVADLVHRSKMHVSRRVRLVSDPALQEAVSSGQLAVSSAERLLRAPKETRAALVQRATGEKWTPAQTEEAVRNLPESIATTDLPPARRAGLVALLRRLRMDVPMLELEGQQLRKEERAELAVWAQRLLRAVEVEV